MVRKWFPLSLTLGAGPVFSLIGWSCGQTVLGILSMTTFGLVDTKVWQTFLKWNKKHDIVSKSITRLTLAFCSTVSGGRGHWLQLEHSGKSESGCWHTSPPPPWLGQGHISGSGHPCRFSEMRVRQLQGLRELQAESVCLLLQMYASQRLFEPTWYLCYCWKLNITEVIKGWIYPLHISERPCRNLCLLIQYNPGSIEY